MPPSGETVDAWGAARILDMHRGGAPAWLLAKLFNTSESTVGRIIEHYRLTGEARCRGRDRARRKTSDGSSPARTARTGWWSRRPSTRETRQTSCARSRDGLKTSSLSCPAPLACRRRRLAAFCASATSQPRRPCHRAPRCQGSAFAAPEEPRQRTQRAVAWRDSLACLCRSTLAGRSAHTSIEFIAR